METLEIVGALQSLVPELIWSNSDYGNSRLNFVTNKKRLNYFELQQACDFLGGKNLNKSKLPNDRFKYYFTLDNYLIVIYSNVKVGKIKELDLNINTKIKFIRYKWK